MTVEKGNKVMMVEPIAKGPGWMYPEAGMVGTVDHIDKDNDVWVKWPVSSTYSGALSCCHPHWLKEIPADAGK